MPKKLLTYLVTFIIVAMPACALAKTSHGGECASCHTLSEKEATELIKKTGLTVTSVKQSPAKGLFELLVEKNGQKGIVFMDYAQKHLVQGMVYDLEKLEPATAHKLDLLQPKQQTSLDVRSIPTSGAIIMGNPRGTQKLYVFTDPDCPYCRKGHEELKKLVRIAPDVAIYIILYPLPMHPGAYDKARTILETKSLEILDQAFEGKDIPKPSKEISKTTIDENIKFANSNGISGTPTMVMPDGKIEIGMRDAETLKKMLEGKLDSIRR
jgi:thiol:disulfide interchange protein DsbC